MIIVSIIVPVHAQLLVDVEVSGDIFTEGDSIVISGKTSTVIPDTPVTLQILFGEGNIVYAAQKVPAEDGSFTETIVAKGPYWQTDGEYIVRAIYGSGEISETTFDFVTKQEATQVENNFEVQIPDSTSTTDVEYSIIGGTVDDIIIDDSRYSMIAIIDATTSGTLTLELPRSTIDAKTNGCEGGDDIFIVFIDAFEVPYQEIDVNSNERVIQIEFEEGDSDVEIIGTCVIPEFGSIAVIVLAISIVSIIALSRKTVLKI